MFDRIVQMFFRNAIRDLRSPGVVDEYEAQDLTKVAQRSAESMVESHRIVCLGNPYAQEQARATSDVK